MIGLARSSLQYRPDPKDDNALRLALIRLAKQYGRYGYRKIAELLRIEGWKVNHKKVERIWREEGLQLPQRHKKRRRLYHKDSSIIRLRPTHPNHVWSIDFVHDKLGSCRSYKMLTVLDEYTRQALAVGVRTRWVLTMSSRRCIHSCCATASRSTSDIRQWSRVRRTSDAGLAGKGRHQAHPDLSRITVGERIQRTLQRNPAS